MKLNRSILTIILVPAAIIFPALAATGPGELRSDLFEDPLDRCQVCHAEIYQQWEGSLHSRAEIDPYYKLLFQIASEETDGLTDTYCSRCHTPIGLTSGEVPPADGSNLSEIAKKGVQCDFCHSVSGSDGIGNAQYILTPDGTKRGPFADSVSSAHGTEYSELHTKSEFCGMCHDVNHPVNDLVLEATYTEWKNGPYSEEGVQCQDCHMTPGITGYEANPGRASGIGPQREHIWTHYNVGGNAFMTGYLGSRTHRDMAVDRLSRAARVDVIPSGTPVAGKEYTFEVRVKNVGAGHYLPTGLTESRQMWLDVAVTDGSGKQIYRSGAMDEHGKIEPGTVIYQTILGDFSGNPTEKVWEAESIISDYRIPPRGEVMESYSFMLPADLKTPINITAELKYRSAHQEFIDQLFGDGELKVPVILMTADSAVLGENGEGIPGFQVIVSIMIVLLILIQLRKGRTI